MQKEQTKVECKKCKNKVSAYGIYVGFSKKYNCNLTIWYFLCNSDHHFKVINFE
jgi:hypothetical protein